MGKTGKKFIVSKCKSLAIQFDRVYMYTRLSFTCIDLFIVSKCKSLAIQFDRVYRYTRLSFTCIDLFIVSKCKSLAIQFDRVYMYTRLSFTCIDLFIVQPMLFLYYTIPTFNRLGGRQILCEKFEIYHICFIVIDFNLGMSKTLSFGNTSII